MSIIELIKKLRTETGQSVLACKDALLKTNHNYEEAKKIVLSLKKEETKSDRIASKGLCHAVIRDNNCVFYELNAETDFISKNTDFIHLVENIGELVVTTNIKTTAEVLAFKLEKEETISKQIEQVKNKLSEQIILRRFYRLEKTSHQIFGLYSHLGKSLCVLIMEGANKAFADQMAKQIIANQIEYLDYKALDDETLKFESDRYHLEKTTLTFEQYLEGKSLLHSFLYNKPNVTVYNELIDHQAKIVDFYKLELGMGIIGKLHCVLNLDDDLENITVTPIVLKHNKL
jgi:elongation factor Ts